MDNPDKPYRSLFSPAELLAMREEWERKQAFERKQKLAEMLASHERVERNKTVPEKKLFVYQSRAAEQWDARANQKRQRPKRQYVRKS